MLCSILLLIFLCCYNLAMMNQYEVFFKLQMLILIFPLLCVFYFFKHYMDLLGVEPRFHPCKGRVLTAILQALLTRMYVEERLPDNIIFLGGDPSAGSPTDTL